MDGIVPFNPSLALQHPSVRLQENQTSSEMDENGKGSGDRYNMGGKVITNLPEIEAIRLVEERSKARKASKIQANSAPSTTKNQMDPLTMLPPAPKRRGRPSMVK